MHKKTRSEAGKKTGFYPEPKTNLINRNSLFRESRFDNKIKFLAADIFRFQIPWTNLYHSLTGCE